MTYSTEAPTTISARDGNAQGLATHLFEAFRAWAGERKTRQMMAQLPDDLLKDAGFIRDDLANPNPEEKAKARSGNW